MSVVQRKAAANRIRPNSARMTKLACNACGWPVVHACCNDQMATSEPFASVDYWGYCSNKACGNHAGEEWPVDENPSFAA